VTRWLDPDRWERVGRGRSVGFQVPTETLTAVLVDLDRSLDGGLTLLTCGQVQDGQEWHSVYATSPVAALPEVPGWQHFLRSARLTPALPAPAPIAPGVWPKTFATNGLIALWHPLPEREPSNPPRSTLALVRRVRDRLTGEVHENDAYDVLYSRLKRRLRLVMARDIQ
jgi:hypothetical protein